MNPADGSIDEARVATLLAVLGGQRLRELVAVLNLRLAAMAAELASGPGRWPGLKAIAHQTRGSASSLGLIALAARLGDFEAAIDRSMDEAGVAPETLAEAAAEVAATLRRSLAALAAGFPDLAAHYDGPAPGASKR